MSPLRIAANVAGATAGLIVAETYILPMLPERFQSQPGVGLDDLVVGACAFGGAMLANLLLSKFQGEEQTVIYTRSVGKAAQASTAEVITWTETDLGVNDVTSPVFQHHITMTGTARDYDALNYIIAKQGGAQFWRASELQHAALLQRFSKKTGPGATATRFTMPYYYGGFGNVVVGAPLGKGLRVEIDIDNTPSATGTLTLFAGRMPGVVPTHYPSYLASAAGIAASATSARYPVTQQGILRGICLPRTTSITDMRLYINNQVVWDLTGPGLLEAQELEQGGTVTLNEFIVTDPFQIVPGATFVELTVDGSWAATDEVAFYSLVPMGQ